MKFVVFNLYYFTQVNLNGIFHVYVCMVCLVWIGVCVCLGERVETERNMRRDREKGKALLISLAGSHR